MIGYCPVNARIVAFQINREIGRMTEVWARTWMTMKVRAPALARASNKFTVVSIKNYSLQFYIGGGVGVFDRNRRFYTVSAPWLNSGFQPSPFGIEQEGLQNRRKIPWCVSPQILGGERCSKKWSRLERWYSRETTLYETTTLGLVRNDRSCRVQHLRHDWGGPGYVARGIRRGEAAHHSLLCVARADHEMETKKNSSNKTTRRKKNYSSWTDRKLKSLPFIFYLSSFDILSSF